MSETCAGKRTPIAIGSDHAGFPLKEELRKVLEAEGYSLHDFGTFSLDRMDYPDIAREVGGAVAAGEFERGILVCGAGTGMSIAANKVRGVRAAASSETYSATMARKHNNANILCLGGRVVGIGLALEITRAFLETDFEHGSRHERRIEKIHALEQQ